MIAVLLILAMALALVGFVVIDEADAAYQARPEPE